MPPPVYRTWNHPTGGSTQGRMPHQSKEKDKNKTQSSADRIVTNTLKYTTSHNPAHQERKKDSPPPTRMQEQVTPITKPTETTQPNVCTEGINQKEEGT